MVEKLGFNIISNVGYGILFGGLIADIFEPRWAMIVGVAWIIAGLAVGTIIVLDKVEN